MSIQILRLNKERWISTELDLERPKMPIYSRWEREPSPKLVEMRESQQLTLIFKGTYSASAPNFLAEDLTPMC